MFRSNFLQVVLLMLVLITPSLGRQSHETGPDPVPFPKETEKEVSQIESELTSAQSSGGTVDMTGLQHMGDALVQSHLWQCNIFGGPAACQPMSRESGFREQCPNRNNLVDCAMKEGAEASFSGDFYGELGNIFKDAGLPTCPACVEKLRQFWCAQAAPSCGAFSGVATVLLPAVDKILTTKEKGRTALKEMMPQLLRALALGLPSREMCEAVLLQCSCGNVSVTFGEALDKIEAGNGYKTLQSGSQDGAPLGPDVGVAQETDISAAMAEDLFLQVRSWKPCDLFVSETTPGFVGPASWTGDAATTQGSEKCEWCADDTTATHAQQKSEARLVFDRVIVAQMLRSISSMMRSGVQHVLDAVGTPDDKNHSGESKDEAAAEAVAAGKEDWNWTDPSASAGQGSGGDAGGSGSSSSSSGGGSSNEASSTPTGGAGQGGQINNPGGMMGGGGGESHDMMHDHMHGSSSSTASSTGTPEGAGRASEKAPASAGGGSWVGSAAGVTLWVLLGFAAVVGCCALYSWRRYRRRRTSEMYVHLSDLGYEPPAL